MARLLWVADNLAAGRRETPQRFIPVAVHAARRGVAGRTALLRFLLADTLAEAESDGGCCPGVLDLLRRTSAAVDGHQTLGAAALAALGPAILALAPRRRRRRSVHCHGQITTDRRLLLLRAVLDDSADWTKGRPAWHHLWLATAYAAAGYERDHFVLLGPAVERRVRRLAGWVGAEAAASGAESDLGTSL